MVVELLSIETAGEYLMYRGLVAPGVEVLAKELGGGVSNVVLDVEAGRLRAVVKQSLPKLRVADEWLAKRERIITEAHALQLTGRVSPGSVPQVLDVDEDRCVIVIDRSPESWKNYKDELLEGVVETRIAESLGKTLAEWHSSTWDSNEIKNTFDDIEAFDQLRLDPYHRTVARRLPELEEQILRHVNELVSDRRCLVHGDFSPKNVLYGTQEIWVLDFEVAHFGNPVFDLAFMLNHLMLKAIHRPQSFEEYRSSALAFWSAYSPTGARHGTLLEEPSGERKFFLSTESSINGQVACLMLARVDGKSPAEYLTEPERNIARSFGSNLLTNPPDSLQQAWDQLRQVLQ